MKKIVFIVLILSSCATSRRSKPCRQCPQHSWWTRTQLINYHTMNPNVNIAQDVKLSNEFLKELRENLIKTGVIIQDTIKIKSNGNEKFNQGDSTTRWIIL
tara:strand:+ start:365 stop:667 length:303 start_codon:yes stop_codon:yes gene_type:complete